jgi:short-subunit dehydrogenase
MSDRNYALVTGASAGIGKAIAFELARRKINLLLVALPSTGLDEVADEIIAQHQVDVRVFECDLTEPDAPQRVRAWAVIPGVAIRVLVNNAGVGSQHAFEETPETLMHTMLKLNNHALVMMTHYILPELKRNAPSYMLNLGSLASFMAIPGKSVYSATKSFIYSFSRSLRLELQPYGVSVSCLCPGATSTSTSAIENYHKVRYKTKSFLQSADAVAREGVAQMFNGKGRIITGTHNKIFFRLSKWLPAFLVNFTLTKLFHRRNSTLAPLRPELSPLDEIPAVQPVANRL